MKIVLLFLSLYMPFLTSNDCCITFACEETENASAFEELFTNNSVDSSLEHCPLFCSFEILSSLTNYSYSQSLSIWKNVFSYVLNIDFIPREPLFRPPILLTIIF